jgi:hypothetical protein
LFQRMFLARHETHLYPLHQYFRHCISSPSVANDGVHCCCGMYRGSPPVTSLRRIPAYILLLSQLHTIHTFKRLFSQLHSLRRVQRTANEKPIKPHNPFFPTLAAAKRPAHFAACNAALVSAEWMTQRTE